MVKHKISNIKDVVAAQMCLGCGACAYISPDEIEMVDVLDCGRRPKFKIQKIADPRSEESIKVCPGIELVHIFDHNAAGLIRQLLPGWGPVLEVWEGHASDSELRYLSSSGGISSALALYCIEQGGMHGVLHTRARKDIPYLNQTVLSRNRNEILEATGSRYAPASPCDGLGMVENASSPCVFIGKPCDVAGLTKVQKLRSQLDKKIGLSIAIFCAGTPSTNGTIDMINHMGITDISKVINIRYRGMGWPGDVVVSITTDKGQDKRSLTYDKAWGGILQKYRQWRCRLCPDHCGEFADIAVGDPWYRTPSENESGSSLILVRTQRGKYILHDAMKGGYVKLEHANPDIVSKSQTNLLYVRSSTWGRVLACRLIGITSPRFAGMPLFYLWLSELDFKQKLQSIFGTIKRILRKGLLWQKRRGTL